MVLPKSKIFQNPKSTSICRMSLAEAFLSRVTQDVTTSMKNTKRKGEGIGFDVALVKTDRQTFIDNYLHDLSAAKKGNLTKLRSTGAKRNPVVYDCERNCNSKGNSTGDPTKTRANGCRAYICFSFEEGATATVCIMRYRLSHHGHNPSNRDEYKLNRIDSALMFCIQEWVQEGLQISEILPKIAQWNKVKGYTDYKDRRFFPFQQDIQHLIWLEHKSQHPAIAESGFIKKHEIGLPTVDNLAAQLKNKYRDLCIFYQPSSFILNNSKPMILVLQTLHQRDVFSLHGDKLVFITKNFDGLRMYGHAIYSLVVKNDSDVAYPVAFIISSSDDSAVLVEGLRKFRETNFRTHPTAFFIDKDLLECTRGINELYPQAKMFIPKYQILKVVHDWLTASTAVAEKSQKDVREVLLKYILDLSKCTTHDLFIKALHELGKRIDFPTFTRWMRTEWFPLGHMWAVFGRAEVFAPDKSAMIAERLFLNLEHQLLKGLQSLTKAEELVEHIAKDLSKSDPEILINMEDFLEGTPEEQAENLLQDGWGSLITWTSKTEVLIPSQSNMQNFFHTKLIPMECECPYPPYRGLCVHLHLALMLVQGKADPELERKRAAEKSWREGRYIQDGDSCVTFHSGTICLTEISDGTCTCKASFFGCDCVGILLTRQVSGYQTLDTMSHVMEDSEMVQQELEVSSEPPKEMVEYTISSANNLQNFSVDQNTILNSNPNENSTKSIIHKLYIWSTSPNFADSPRIQSQVAQVWNEIIKNNDRNYPNSEESKICAKPSLVQSQEDILPHDVDGTFSSLPPRFKSSSNKFTKEARNQNIPYQSSLRENPRKSPRYRSSR